MIFKLLFVMFVLNSCTRSEVPVQECNPPDTTGVENSMEELVWDTTFIVDDVIMLSLTTLTAPDGITVSMEWDSTDNTLDAVDGDATVTETTISSSDSFTVTLETVGDITALDSDISTTSEWVYPPYSDTIYELLELYKEYEAQSKERNLPGFVEHLRKK